MSSKWRNSNTKNFSIRELEKFSGVKAHTLRIWERRYAMLQPQRSAGNIRMYPLEELKRLLQVAVLNRHGYRISQIFKMDEGAINVSLQLLDNNTALMEKALADLTVGMYAGESDKIIQLLNKLLKDWSLEVMVENIIYPFLHNTSLLWVGNKLYEEHIAVTAIRQKLQYAIERLQPSTNNATTILLFLTDTRQLDLGLLYCHYLFKRNGCKVLYLGNDITLSNLKSALEFNSFTHVFTYLKNPTQSNVDELLSVIQTYSTGSTLVIGDYHFPPSSQVTGKNILKLPFTQALHAILNCHQQILGAH